MVALFLFTQGNTYGQTHKVNEFWNEFSFTKPLAKGWSGGIDLLQQWSSNNNSKSLLASYNQVHFRGWIHYYPGARWKTSLGIGYIDYEEVESVQPQSNEWRWTLEASYYVKKIGYTLRLRSRIENRGKEDSTEIRKTAFRFREELKFLYPLGGSKIIRGKIWYLIASDEVMFQSTLTPSFDRNRLTLGTGYAVTDDIQIEMTYVNQYIPRQKQDQLYQALQVNFVFNNFLSNLARRWKKPPDIPSAPQVSKD